MSKKNIKASKCINNEFRLCNNSGLIPIKINKTLSNKLSRINKKIFTQLDETNNGVISNCSVLLKTNNCNKKKGGTLLYASSDYREYIPRYCEKIQIEFNKQYSKMKDNNKDYSFENKIMQKFIEFITRIIAKTTIPDGYDNQYLDDLLEDNQYIFDYMSHELIRFFINSIKEKKIKYGDLQYSNCINNREKKEICDSYIKEYANIDITIDYNPVYPDIRKKVYIDNNTQLIKFHHSGYNKDIVCAYEQKYIDNKDNMQSFIDEQKEFIEDMSFADKVVINDYTEFQTFTFYIYYINRGSNQKWLKKYIDEKQSDAFTFGDSFYKQILELYPDIFNGKLATRGVTIYKTNEIGEYWGNNGRADNRNIKSIFSELSQEEWENIIAKFINDVNNIILSAPKLKTDIYCYRGSSIHYVKHNAADFCKGIKINPSDTSDYFLSSRLSSYSLNFDKSFEYLMKSDNVDKRCMYRTVISKGSKVLFIPQISDAPHELEILTPINSLIAYRQYDSGISEPFDRNSYNNRNNEYGICSLRKFNSADIVIYPPANKTSSEEIHEIKEEIHSNDFLDNITLDENGKVVECRIPSSCTNGILIEEGDICF